MLRLTPPIRLRESAELPDGSRVAVDCDIEARLPVLLRYLTAAAEVAQSTATDAERERFYRAYADFLKAVLGAENWTRLRSAFNADEAQICELMSEWVSNTVIPALLKASKRNLRRKKRDAR